MARAHQARVKLASPCLQVAVLYKLLDSAVDQSAVRFTFRRTKVAFDAAKVDPSIIRSWLGHVSLETTNRYAQANLETKRKAIEQVDGIISPAKPPRWRRDQDLLAWLDSL